MAKATEGTAPTAPPTSDPEVIGRLAAKRDKWRTQARDLQQQLTAAQAERDQARTELAQAQTRANASASARRVAELEQQLRDRDHRDAFRRVAVQRGARPDGLDDLWTLSGYRAESDQVDEEAMGALIDEQRASRGYLFGESNGSTPGAASTPAPVAKPVPGAGRGGAHQPSKSGVLLTRAQMADPEFMLNPANKDLIQSAARDHRFEGAIGDTRPRR